MSTEENKAIQRRWIEEGWNKHDPDLVDELFDADFVMHSPGRPEGDSREDFKNNMIAALNTFPDLHVTLDDQIAEGDKVVNRLTFAGTHSGEYMGVPATGKQVSSTSINIDRFLNGKYVEIWNESDNLGFLQQLGVIPPMGEGEG
jgi:steroid delta-isomerase-like uncharacterized protein